MLRSKMRFRLAAAPSASRRPRCNLIRVSVTCVGPVPGPMCIYRPTRSGTRGLTVQLVAPPCTDTVHGVDFVRAHQAPTSINLAHDSASVRRRPRSGATSANLDIDRRTRYFRSVISCTLIDIFGISDLTYSSMQTLVFQHLCERLICRLLMEWPVFLESAEYVAFWPILDMHIAN